MKKTTKKLDNYFMILYYIAMVHLLSQNLVNYQSEIFQKYNRECKTKQKRSVANTLIRIVKYYSFDELKLIVILISFRMIFLRYNFYYQLLSVIISYYPVFSRTQLVTAKCKNKTVITPSTVTHRYSKTYCQAEAVLLYPFTYCLKRRNTLSHNDDF